MIQRVKIKKRGFTLIELLVVIGIIGILSSLLLPVLSRGKNSAKRAQCLSNLRQLILAATNYAHEDHRGNFSPSVNKNDTDLNYLKDQGVKALKCFVCPSTGNRIRPEVRGENKFDGRPGLQDLIQTAASSGSVDGKSYTIYSFIGDGIWTEIEDKNGTRWVPWLKKTASSVNSFAHTHDNLGMKDIKPGPANIFLLLDINSREWNGQPDRSDNHGAAGGNVAFCDGHVEWIPEPKYFYRIELSQDNGANNIKELNADQQY